MKDKILGSRHINPTSPITSGEPGHGITQMLPNSSTLTTRSFFGRSHSQHDSSSQTKSVETSAPAPLLSAHPSHNDNEALSCNIATAPADACAPTESTPVFHAAEHLVETVSGLRAVPRITDIAHISACKVNAAGATFNAIGGNQVNYAANPLHILPYVEGASWDLNLVCLDGTRTALLDDIWQWINEADGSKAAEIFLLMDVAGSGKSAIAHTVAQRSHSHGLLASSFFFSRDIPDRRVPQKLFSTITRDLASWNKDHAQDISRILEDHRSLASASQSRQFEGLILEPFSRHRIDQPIVIVIDALDEGCDSETVSILRNRVPKLPGTFRLVVTSRPSEEITTGLLNVDHVRCRSIDIHGSSNQMDIALYINDRLRHISSRKRLGLHWPGSQLTLDFTTKAEGLFIWVSTISNYLCDTTYPHKKLRKLLYQGNAPGLHAEVKMDDLYAQILSSCPWDDEDFANDYQLLVGAIMAARTPLSITALQSLHRTHPTLDVAEILRPLASLFTGLSDSNQPIQIIHLSFRDFLTHRAQSSPLHQRFYIDEREQSKRLALLCLLVMNEGFKACIPGTGYLIAQPETDGILPINESDVPEVLWYATRFWTEHIIKIEPPVSEIILDQLRIFFSTHLVVWIEILVSKFQFQSLFGVRAWLQRICPNDAISTTAASSKDYTELLYDLSSRLLYMDRREDALKAIEEAVELSKRLAADHPAAFTPVLAMSLNNFSNRLSDLGRREDALKAIEEAVDLRRRLATDRPAAFIPYLAVSINNLSLRLSDLGRREDALKVIEEAVELRRRLVADRPAVFIPAIPDLAVSLNNLSLRLSDLGRREDALKVIEEAVELRRQLAADYPAAFIPDLAMSLNNLSSCLADLGRREDALRAVEEAVELRRQLAADRPATFIPSLTTSLNNLSTCLADLGRREDALRAIEEAVELSRRLAADRPAAFIPDLTMSLNNLSNCLADLGRQEDALRAIEEAVELRRRLSADRPVAFIPSLTTSLNNLSNCLAGLGHREDALRAIEEAVKLYRRLAADRPATFIPNLTVSLNNLSNRLSELGRQEDALKAIEEAVELRRRLAADRPAAFIPDLAMSLNNFSLCLSDLGRREDALGAIEDAVKLYRRLAADRPTAFIPNLITSINNLSTCLVDLGRREDALKAIEEAVELCRRLAADHPAAFIPDLAMSLNNISLRLSDLGHRKDAQKAVKETVDLCRRLAADHPAVFNEALSHSLKIFSDCSSSLSYQTDVPEAAQEADALG